MISNQIDNKENISLRKRKNNIFLMKYIKKKKIPTYKSLSSQPLFQKLLACYNQTLKS